MLRSGHMLVLVVTAETIYVMNLMLITAAFCAYAIAMDCQVTVEAV